MQSTPKSMPRELRSFESDGSNPFATVVMSGKRGTVETYPGHTLVDFTFDNKLDMGYVIDAIRGMENAKMFFHAKANSNRIPSDCLFFYIVPCGNRMYTLCLNSHDGKNVCDAALCIYRDLSLMRNGMNSDFEQMRNERYDMVETIDFNEFLLDFYG